jgi:hypothetical protein
MPSVSPDTDTLQATLREVVETLAVIDRPPCSPGERAAAEWLAERLRAVAGVEVALEDEPWAAGECSARCSPRALSPASLTRPRTGHGSYGV